MKSISIEYSHIYTSQTFGREQADSVALLKQKENQLGVDFDITKVILIDDCSTPFSIDRFDFVAFQKALAQQGAEPEHFILESSLDASCEFLVDQISQKSLRRGIKNYYQTRKRWPCSMYIATWYLIRLGELSAELLSPQGRKTTLPRADQLITLLPDRFITPEEEAKRIVYNSPYKSVLGKIQVEYFQSSYEKYSDWDEFDPAEYVKRNYMNQILPEDEAIMYFTSDYLHSHSNRLQSVKSFADVGCGPNLYPLMTVAPYLAKDADIELLDYSKNNLEFLKTEIKNPKNWDHFQRFLNKHEAGLYAQEVINNTLKLAKPKQGSIYKLPKQQYDMITSFFVAESITDKEADFDKAIKALLQSVKPGGLVLVSHMLGSSGYFAGWQTSFPAYDLSLSKIEEIYEELEELEIFTVRHTENQASRKGYKGMAAVAGFKR